MLNVFQQLTTINKFLTTLVLLLGLITLGAFSYKQLAEAKYAGLSEDQGIITVTGKAEFKATPKKANVNIYIKETAPTSKEAKNKVTQKVNKVLDICKNLNIPDKNIDTKSFHIYPDYSWENNKRVFNGYRASQSITIKTDSIQTAEKLIGMLADYGITNVNYSSRLDENEIKELREKAKEQAIKDARQKAEKLAKQLGVHLGKLISYTEGNDYRPEPIPMLKAGVASNEEETITPSLPQGEQTRSVTVTLKYRIW